MSSEEPSGYLKEISQSINNFNNPDNLIFLYGGRFYSTFGYRPLRYYYYKLSETRETNHSLSMREKRGVFSTPVICYHRLN